MMVFTWFRHRRMRRLLKSFADMNIEVLVSGQLTFLEGSVAYVGSEFLTLLKDGKYTYIPLANICAIRLN